MIKLCTDARLPEPEFRQQSGSFILTLWRDWLTDEILAGFNLTIRQLQAVTFVKKTGKINNAGYREITGTTRKTATRDLDGLVEKKIFKRIGEKRGVYYILSGWK